MFPVGMTRALSGDYDYGEEEDSDWAEDTRASFFGTVFPSSHEETSYHNYTVAWIKEKLIVMLCEIICCWNIVKFAKCCWGIKSMSPRVFWYGLYRYG